jgi:hypothetical protein
VDEYGDLAKSQDESIGKARDSADNGNMIANILKGLSGVANADTISRGGKGYDVSNFDKVIDANNARVKEAQAGKEGALGDLLKKYNLRNTEEDRARGDERYGQEKITNKHTNQINASSAESHDPNSSVSRQAVLTGKSVLLSKAKTAAAAGDKQAADSWLAQANQLDGLSAARVSEIINMSKSVDYEGVLNRRHQESIAAGQAKRDEVKENKYKAELRRNIRNDIEKKPSYKDYQQTSAKLDEIASLAKETNGVSDEAIIVKYQKLLDEGSVVREGEFARTREAAGFLDKIKMAKQAFVNGQRISPEMRKQIIETGRLFHEAARKALINKTLAPYMEEIRLNKIDPKLILDSTLIDEQPAAEQNPTAPQAPKSSGVQIKSVKDLPPI